MGKTVSNKLLALISDNGCVIKPDSELQKLHIGTWFKATMHGAYGLYSSQADASSIFFFESNCPKGSEDYVLAHEFGHFLSYSLEHGIHTLVKANKHSEIQADFKNLMTEEEFRADTFAMLIANYLGFNAPEWVIDRRLPQYDSLSMDRKTDLTLEVINMIGLSFINQTKGK